MANSNIHIQLDKLLKDKIQKVRMGVTLALNYVGNEAVIHARDPQRDRYKDQTGNLTSSIGYVVATDGQKQTEGGFQPIMNGSEGASKGKAYADTLASEDTHEMSLVVVAGMPYGKYVQAKGYDVLNSAELLAKKLAKQKIQEAIKKALK